MGKMLLEFKFGIMHRRMNTSGYEYMTNELHKKENAISTKQRLIKTVKNIWNQRHAGMNTLRQKI